MTFTRGPWFVRPSIKGPYICAGEGTLAETAIAKVLKVPHHGQLLSAELERDGNAQLMAAAPLLHDMVERTIEDFRTIVSMCGEEREINARTLKVFARHCADTLTKILSEEVER